MSTTTIRIDDQLKARVAAVAERAGKTPHSFIVEVVADTVAQAERNDDFHRLSGERWATVLATGKTIPWEDAKAYLLARAKGEKPPKPRTRKIGN